MTSDLPLITFAVIAYNQDRYIRQAIEGALSQDYPKLEVILSDDCSTDRTFDIIREVAGSYSGRHAIIINRTPLNRGIGHHVNAVHELAKGELIVCADGDDVSLPQRTRVVCDAWRESPDPPSLICTNARRVAADGAPLGTVIPETFPRTRHRLGNPMVGCLPMIGCTIAIHRDVVRRFGPMRNEILAADTVWYRRAYLLNGLLYVPEVTVDYRQGSGGVSQRTGRYRDEYLRTETRTVKDRLVRAEQMRGDVRHIAPSNEQEILASIDREERAEARRLAVLSGTLPASIGSLAQEYVVGTGRWPAYRESVRAFMIRWLPSLIKYRKRRT